MASAHRSFWASETTNNSSCPYRVQQSKSSPRALREEATLLLLLLSRASRREVILSKEPILKAETYFYKNDLIWRIHLDWLLNKQFSKVCNSHFFTLVDFFGSVKLTPKLVPELVSTTKRDCKSFFVLDTNSGTNFTRPILWLCGLTIFDDNCF